MPQFHNLNTHLTHSYIRRSTPRSLPYLRGHPWFAPSAISWVPSLLAMVISINFSQHQVFLLQRNISSPPHSKVINPGHLFFHQVEPQLPEGHTQGQNHHGTLVLECGKICNNQTAGAWAIGKMFHIIIKYYSLGDNWNTKKENNQPGRWGGKR